MEIVSILCMYVCICVSYVLCGELLHEFGRHHSRTSVDGYLHSADLLVDVLHKLHRCMYVCMCVQENEKIFTTALPE